MGDMVQQGARTSFESQEALNAPLLGGRAVEPGTTKKAWKRINLKMDLGILPLLSLLYLFNGLDRGNIGSAQTKGFTDDIGVRPDDLNLAVSLFFVTFVLFQPLSVGVGWRLGPARWIPAMMMAWGIATIAHAFIRGRGMLIVARLLLGVFEAGFYPTAVAYLAAFYPRYDLAVRIALFYGHYAIANAFSGALAYAIFSIAHPGFKGWQLLFIIEGVLTCGLAIVAWAWLPREPGTAWFLSRSERVLAAERVQLDPSGQARPAAISKRDVMETAKDWKLWFALCFNICASVPASALSVFLPLVVQGMGYRAVEANLMAVPPALCGATGLFLFALSSDRRQERGYHIAAALMIVLAGLIAVVVSSTSTAKYVALCVLLFGSSVPPPLTVAWLSGNTPAPGKRALVLGVNGLGNLAGVIGAQLYRPAYAPDYREALLATLAFVAAAMAGVVAYRVALQAVNRRRAVLRARKSDDEIAAERTNNVRYADQKWTFAYGL